MEWDRVPGGPEGGRGSSSELEELRMFIEAQFVKQSIHFEELVDGLREKVMVGSNRSSKSMKQQGARLMKTYSNVTLETDIELSEDDSRPSPLVSQKGEEVKVQKEEPVQEERFDGTEHDLIKECTDAPPSGSSHLPVPTRQAERGKRGHQTSADVLVEDEETFTTSKIQLGQDGDRPESVRPERGVGKRLSNASVAKSDDTFVGNNVRRTINRAEAVVENSVEGVKRFSRGLHRTGTVEIDIDEISPMRSWCFRLVTHGAFTNCIQLLILLNLVLLGIEVDAATQLGQFDIPRWYGIVNTGIVCVFLVEITLKFIAFGVQGFLCGKDSFWNNLDMLVIGASVLETAVELWDLSLSSSNSGSSAAHLRIMRTMRLVRALRGIRVIRLLRYVSALRTLVLSIVSTMGSLMWTLVLLQLLFYSFGVILTQIVSDHCRDEAITLTQDSNAIPQCSEQLLVRFWKDVPESMCTLLLAISGRIVLNCEKYLIIAKKTC